jgi:hypothetical protein
VTKPVGRLTYTQLLNTRGGIEADLTVARLPKTGSTSSPAPVSAPMIWPGSASMCPTAPM